MITEQNARYEEDLPQVTDKEFRDVVHYELYNDQQQAVAKRAERLARIPGKLVEKTLRETETQLEDRLTAFEKAQAETAAVTEAFEAKRVQAVAAEIVLGRDSAAVQKTLKALATQTELRVRQIIGRDNFQYAEFATLMRKIVRLEGVYVPTNENLPTEPLIPKPVHVPPVFRRVDPPSQDKAAEAAPARMPRVEEARQIHFSVQLQHDTTPAEVPTRIPKVKFESPNPEAALSKEVSQPRVTILESIARALYANPDTDLTSADLAGIIYGAPASSEQWRTQKQTISATLSLRADRIAKYLPEGVTVQSRQVPMYPNAAERPGVQKKTRTVLRLVTKSSEEL